MKKVYYEAIFLPIYLFIYLFLELFPVVLRVCMKDKTRVSHLQSKSVKPFTFSKVHLVLDSEAHK